MDDTTIQTIQTTLDSIRTRVNWAIEEFNQGNYRDSALLLLAMIPDLCNVTLDLNRHLLNHKLKE